LALLGHSTVELGGRSGNLAWHAPTNDYRKTKFPCRKTRIAGISQSKFVPTVANDLRRKMRGWMRVGVELLPHPDSAINPAASNGTVKIDSVDVFMAFSLLLLRCCSPDIISNLLAPDQRSGSQLGLLLPAMSCAFKLYYYSHDELWRFASCFLSLRGPETSTGDGGRGEFVLIADRKQLWRMRARRH